MENKKRKLTQIEKDCLITLCITSTLGHMYPNQKDKTIKIDGMSKDEKLEMMEFMEKLDCVKDDDSIYESLNLLANECYGRIKKKIEKTRKEKY